MTAVLTSSVTGLASSGTGPGLAHGQVGRNDAAERGEHRGKWDDRVRLWLRTRSGEGRARFTLWADAFSSKQSQAVFEDEPAISNRWTRIELPFSRFSRISRAGIDFFSIEVIGDGPCDFLMDDVELMGRRSRPWD